MVGYVTTHTTDWLAELRGRDIAAVADAVGVRITRDHAAPCPACGAERRGGHDRRGPVRVQAATSRWICTRCEAGGGVVDLVAWAICGCQPRDRHTWARLREWAGGVDIAAMRPAAPCIDEPMETPRLPRAEVERFLRGALPPKDAVGATAAFLERRGYDAARLAPYARALRPGAAAAWWPAEWSASWSLVVPAWTAAGVLAGVHGRAVDGRTPKTRWPLARVDGVTVAYSRLLFAGGVALAGLRGSWDGVRRLIIVEGLTDYLAAVCAADDGDAILGGTSGSWGALADVHPPRAVPIYAATDDDDTGRRYAEQIANAMAPRPVLRMAP